ncbi:MAG: PilN domain-containing protein [bacterium]
MHVNFATKKKLELNINSLKQVEFNRLTMMAIAAIFLIIMLVFGFVQKQRLDKNIKVKMALSLEVDKKNQTKPDKKQNKETKIFSKEDVANLYTKRVLWSEALMALTKNIPTGVWLSSLKNKSSLEIEIHGEATNQLVVASLIQRLQEAAAFKTVRLQTSERSKEKNKSTLRFVALCELN